ncbi:MAG: potassium channel family protein [Gammaproteobacteria bacterium]|nr:potassium channel family protein [Gammaproteobacteria bacterium]
MTKRRIWEIIEPGWSGDATSRVFDIFLVSIILLNVIAVILGSVTSIQQQYGQALHVFEVVSVSVFTIEYIARIWSCTILERFQSPITGRIRFALRPLLIIDLLAILPFFLPFLGLDLRFARSLRIVRLLRILKLARYSSALQEIGRAISSKREELILTTVVLVLLLIVSSSLMYFAENQAQPKAFPDIPSAMWWSVVTLTTVGYGDVYPITLAGKLLAAIIAVLGIGMVALPTGIIGASFIEGIGQRNMIKEPKNCPHCGRKISGE